MKQPAILLLLCIAIISTASECKKPKPPQPDNPYGLPNATQTGADIFACRVNGSNWISKKLALNLGGGIVNDTLFIYASNPETYSFYERFDIRIHNYNKLFNPFLLNDSNTRYSLFSTTKPCLANIAGYGIGRVKNYEGELHSTKIDTINKIISGTFWFNIKTDYCDTLKITDGRFDIKYN